MNKGLTSIVIPSESKDDCLNYYTLANHFYNKGYNDCKNEVIKLINSEIEDENKDDK